jgi:hypothetical protein
MEVHLHKSTPTGPDDDIKTLILSADESLEVTSSAPKVDVPCDARNLAYDCLLLEYMHGVHALAHAWNTCISTCMENMH